MLGDRPSQHSHGITADHLNILNLDKDFRRGSDVRCLLTELRNETTDCPSYRSYLAQFYEGYIFPEFLRILKKRNVTVRTAMGFDYLGKAYEPSAIVALEIPRAGTLPTDLFMDRVLKLPGARPNIDVARAVIDIKRKEEGEALLHVVNYRNLPETTNAIHVVICDQMLATGNTIANAISIIYEKYGLQIKDLFIGSVVGAPQGVENIKNQVNARSIKTTLVLGALDNSLDAKSYIVPGLGDAGDRVSGVWRPTL